MLTKLTDNLCTANQKLIHEEYKTRKNNQRNNRFLWKIRRRWASGASKFCNGWLWLWGNDWLMTLDVVCSPNCWCKQKERSNLRNDDKKWILKRNKKKVMEDQTRNDLLYRLQNYRYQIQTIIHCKFTNLWKCRDNDNRSWEYILSGGNWELNSCPYCGQGLIPFKLGVCVCGMQVGSIQYVIDTEKFAKNQYHFYVGTSKVEKLGIVEMMDNWWLSTDVNVEWIW